MWFLLLCGLFFAAAVATFVWRRVLIKYQLIFAKEHFIEFAQALAELKKKHLEGFTDSAPAKRLDRTTISPGDAPPNFVTSAGLALLYSVRPEGPRTAHHLSLSYRGQPIAYAAATTFLAFAARLLGLPPERLAVSRSPRGIYHAHLLMTEPEYADFREREIEIPYPDQIREIQQRCNEDRARCWPPLRLEAAGVTPDINISAEAEKGAETPGSRAADAADAADADPR
ncbi:MAG: hypothetical protein U1A78_21570 [Polyangia bacterium]